MSNSSDAWYFSRSTDLAGLLEQTYSESFWLTLNPELTISPAVFSSGQPAYDLSPSVTEELVTQVAEEGYFQVPPVIPKDDCAKLARAVERIAAAGLHPIFLAVYDEYWRVIQRICKSLSPVLGPDCFPLGDFWVWNVSPQTAGAGWPPHRDYQFRSRPCLRDDGRPLIITAWLPFTQATTLNGCMYVLPTNHDPNIPEELDNYVFSNLQDVRALPAEAGSILGWNQHLLHWGSRCSRWAKAPRISSGIYLQSADVDRFVPRPIDFARPLPLERRLAFLAVNLLAYHRLHRYPDEVVMMCIRHLQAVPDFLEILPQDLRQAMAGMATSS